MNWFLNRKLSFKLIVSVSLLLILAFGYLIGTNLNEIYKTSLEQGESKAREALEEVSNRFQGQIDNTTTALSALRTVILDASSSRTLTREDVIRVLTRELEGHQDVLAMYTLWEPNQFDQKDKINVNKHPYDDATGRFIPYVVRSDNKIIVEPLVDYEKEGTGDYYLIPKKTKKAAWTEPYWYPINGKDVLITSVAMPILNNQGEFVGIVAADIALTDLQKQIEQLKPLGGYTAMITSKGTYAANGKSPDKVSKSYTDDPDLKAVWADVQKGKTSTYTPGENGEVLRLYKPIFVEGSDEVWYMESVVSKGTILENFKKTSLLSLFVSFATLALICTILFFIIHKFVLRPTQAVNQLSVKLAQGHFTEKLAVKGKDEFGKMAEQFNTMVDQLREMISSVSEHTVSVGAMSEQLSTSAEQTSRDTETVVNSIQEMAAGSEAQLQSADETSRTMKEMAGGVQKIAESAAFVADSAQEVTAKTVVGNENIQQTIRQMKVFSNNMDDFAQVIGRLSERSEAIENIVEINRNISTQTNLLALNAAIEASRAGEHGRGFAIVAGEVRKLAEQSKAASNQIAELIAEIREEMKQAATHMERGNSDLAASVQAVSESGQLFASITGDMNRVNEQVQGVSSASEEISASTEQVLATIEQLANIAQVTSENAKGVVVVSEEQLATMEEITASTESLDRLVQELLDLISRFKV